VGVVGRRLKEGKGSKGRRETKDRGQPTHPPTGSNPSTHRQQQPPGSIHYGKHSQRLYDPQASHKPPVSYHPPVM
jgi:hypothetical protein